jgi:hypothetical protein
VTRKAVAALGAAVLAGVAVLAADPAGPARADRPAIVAASTAHASTGPDGGAAPDPARLEPPRLEPAGPGPHDLLFGNPGGVPVIHLDASAIDSIGRAISDSNVALIHRIDEAYRAGHYGDPSGSGAKDAARAALIYNAHVAFDFVSRITMQDDAIYSTSEADLREAFTRSFRNPGIYPIMNLKEARAGLGRYCMRFEVEDPARREITVSGEKMKCWTEDVKFDDGKRRVVNIDMMTFSNDRVHVVYEAVSCGTMQSFETEMDGWPVRVVTMEALEGQYVRKFGFHKPEAVVLWKSASGGALDPPPADRRYLGSAIWFPRLKLELPLFLPSIGFHDLRKFDFPEPVLTTEATDGIRALELAWLDLKNDQRFADWEGDGQVPGFVSARFPDR